MYKRAFANALSLVCASERARLPCYYSAPFHSSHAVFSQFDLTTKHVRYVHRYMRIYECIPKCSEISARIIIMIIITIAIIINNSKDNSNNHHTRAERHRARAERGCEMSANFSAARDQLTSPLFFAPVLSLSTALPALRPTDRHPSFATVRIFTILRVEKVAFFRPRLKRLRTERCPANAEFSLFPFMNVY